MPIAAIALPVPWLWPPLVAAAAGIGLSQWVVERHPEHAKTVTVAAKVIGLTAAGAAIGSAVPVVGTLIGAGIGLVLGGIWAWAGS